MNKKRLIILIVVVILITAIATLMIGTIKNISKEEKSCVIVATKKDEENFQNELKYKIQIKNYDIENIEKEITFKDEEQAQSEYARYNIINAFGGENLNVQIKKEKLIILMTEEQFKEDIEYDEQKNITHINSSGEQKEIMSQEEIINALIKQGYTIK